MTLWWQYQIAEGGQFYDQPWDTWFYAKLPAAGTGHEAMGWPGWTSSEPGTYYHFRKITAEGTHQAQLAIKSPVDRPAVLPSTPVSVKANVVYVLTDYEDTPNWGNGGDALVFSPPCGNYHIRVYGAVDEVTRSQTWGILAALQADREKASGIKACIAARVADTGLDIGILAAIQSELQLDVGILAAILGEAERYLPIKAAVRGEGLLEPAIIAACAKTDELAIGALATIAGNPQVHSHLKAAVLGETEKAAGIKAFVVNTRVDHILLEMENLFPQELDLRSTPNWASKVKDYRQSTLSARDS